MSWHAKNISIFLSIGYLAIFILMIIHQWFKIREEKGPYGYFFRCSNYKTMDCKFTRKIQEKSGEKEKDLTIT